MKTFAALPVAVQTVQIPLLFSPTSLSRAFDCRLSAVLSVSIRGEARLPPDPRAILGTVFHRLVELAAKGQLNPEGEPASTVRAALSQLMRDTDQELSASGFAHYVPLASTISYPEYLDRRARAVASALAHWSQRIAVPTTGARLAETSAIGAEKSFVSEELRLTGRIDFLERDGDAIVVRDLKTGNVRGHDGAIAEHIILQLRLYGLLALNAFPGRRVRLVVDHQLPEELPFDSADIAQIEHQRVLILEQLKPGTASAIDLASVGVHCRLCDVRHMCPSYRSEIPGQWGIPRTDYALPLDIWGRLEERPQSRTNGEHSVRLIDDASRHVSIIALDDRHGPFDGLAPGARLWFFGLEARGMTRNIANEYSHPSNFRELKTGGDERRAFRLRVFRESEEG